MLDDLEIRTLNNYMPADIQTFYNIAQQKQFSRDFFMRVKQITIAGLQLNGENELVFAKTATLPGRQIEDKPINYSILSNRLG